MRVVLNYKSFLKSSATPMTPLYTGSWNPRFSTKWLGVAAELSYNPYLRNGWVAVDTGVKGGVGSPLIEFSTWEAENSTHNIVIPNSFSYRFLTRKDNCTPKFLARSSVEANEWWFIASGQESILNLWGRNFSSASRVRVQFKAITYLNYRFKGVNSHIRSALFGTISSAVNNVFGVSSEDVNFRDLSINFLYLNKIARHRGARIRFFLYERGTISGACRNFGSYKFCNIFADQFFSQFVQKHVLEPRAIVSSTVSEEFQLFNRTPLSLFSFEHLVGNLSATVLFFLEFRGVPTLVNFFLTLLRSLVERLVFLFAASFKSSQRVSKQWLTQLSTFVVRRLASFLLTTYLSAYSFLIVIVYMIRDFVLRTLTDVSGARTSFVFDAQSNVVRLYGYKLRQLASSFASNLPSKNILNNIFLTNKLSVSSLLGEYAKHRGRGLRLFRRRRNLLRRKKKFNFVGRWPKNYFYKKRGNALDEAAGFTFSRRLHQLRRILKFSSSSGQFTFLFFWSFQFFNFSQLNLKKRKFFFLAMRLAYFFKSFFRFFKFYAFYFKLLREWDVKERELYSNNDKFAVNLKTYCALLFLKFSRVLINFKLFCEKIFFLKWKRFCATSLNDLQNMRRALISSFNWTQSGSVLNAGRVGAAVRVRRGLPTLSVKFLSWSYATFTNMSALKTISGVAVSSRQYLKYLLKLRLMYVKLYTSRVGFALQSLIAERSQLSEVPCYLLEASLSSWFARSLWKLPFWRSSVRTRSAFLKIIGRVLSTSTILIFAHKGCLYLKRGKRGLIRKISPVDTRVLIRQCLSRKRRLKPWIFTGSASKSYVSVLLAGCRKFVSNIYGAAEIKFTAVAGRVSILKNSANALAKQSIFFFVKRSLLAWKLLARTQIQCQRFGTFKSENALLSSTQLAFLFPDEIGRIRLLNLLRSRSISGGFRRYSFSEFNPKKLVLVSSMDEKARQEHFYEFSLAKIERVYLGAVCSVLSLVDDNVVKSAAKRSLFNSVYSYSGVLGSVFTVLTGRPTVKVVLGGLKTCEFTKTDKFGPAKVFLDIWGLYLTNNTWSASALDILSYNVHLEVLTANLMLLYNVAFGVRAGGFVFDLFLTCSEYLRMQFAVLKSLVIFRTGILRRTLFNNLTGVYLRAYFFRNFFFKKRNIPVVVSGALLPLKLVSALNLQVPSLISFKAAHKLRNWFGGLLIGRFSAPVNYLLSDVVNSRSYGFGVKAARKVCIAAEGTLRRTQESLNFNSIFSAFRPVFALTGAGSSYGYRTLARSRRLFSLLRARGSVTRFFGLRLNTASKVWRTYRWVTRMIGLGRFYNQPSTVTRVAAVNFLKNILWFVNQSNPISSRAGPVGFSNRTYSWRIGRFFNLVRSMHPLKLLVYAKKMGIWPKHLRLRPKKIKQKRVFEINPAKNKQSLVPDKNFKMPPSIFSRDNYDSMNLVLDFPNEDYRFAKINTYKWVRAWRFARNLDARRLLVFLRRRLRVRYFKRTFRYRRFLRKRWFRNKLKKIAYRALVRASAKLRALHSLKIIYRGGVCVRFFSRNKLYYSPILTHSLILARFFRALSSKFVQAKISLRINFMRSLKLQFLFLLSVSFFKKMLNFFTSFVWVYRMTFSGDISFAWCFNKLNSLWLAAVRMYSLGASYYWTEPLALFNTKLLSNYTEEGFFKVRRLSDFFVIRTIGPDYYPYHTLIASLPWRTDSVQAFQPYATFLAFPLFHTIVNRLSLRSVDLRSVLENFSVFADILDGEFFQTCGFRIRLPVRRRGNKVVHAVNVGVYTKPTRRAQIIRLLRKLIVLKSRHRSKKMKLGIIRESRNSLSNLNYVDNSRSFFTSLLRLRPIYITLPKYGVKLKYYRSWCRIVRVIADARRRSRPARLNVTVGGDLHYCHTMRRYVKRRRFNARFNRYPLRMHWRQRKACARRGVIFNAPAVLRRVVGRARVNARFSRWKRPALFSRRVYGGHEINQ